MSTNPTGTLDLTGLELFDHHCHGVVADDLDREAFEALISESSRPAPEGCTRFDTQVGFGIRRYCAPILGLPTFATADEYVKRRAELGADEVNRRLLAAAELGTLGIETGHSPESITTPQETADLAGASAYEIIRLERIAENVAHDRLTRGLSSEGFFDEVTAEIDRRSVQAIGVKSIAAYRIGLDFDAARPSTAELASAADTWFSSVPSVHPRLDDATIIRGLIWHAIDRSHAIQLHIGYGDDDVDLHRCNPLLLTGLLRATVDSGARFMLLHCYPFHREAGYLADVFPHVYCDVGLAVNYTGSRSDAIIAESLELTPFHKALFSTDAFGAAELYLLGAVLFRRGLAATLETFMDIDGWPEAEARRVAGLIGRENAMRAYRLN